MQRVEFSFMRMCRGLLVLTAALGTLIAVPAAAAKRTVCTMTLNSADEKDAFRRYLPTAEYEFVELVQPGQRDWLSAACRKQIHCDVLVVSGHFNGQDFFSDRLDVSEFLPVEDLERASCSESCPGVFEHLQEVYLFGCTTLSPEPVRSMSGDVVRSLMRDGQGRADAEREASILNERYGRTNRDVMRRVFADVPVIYGFSAVAPLGATAGPLLARYFQGARGAEMGRGRPSRKLLGQFSAHSLAAAHGVTDADPDADYRSESCALLDERSSAVEKLQFVGELLDRDMGQVRLFFDDIERFLAKVPAEARTTPAFVQARSAIAADRPARERYLAFARDADAPALRARMTTVAGQLAWLTPEQQRDEFVSLVEGLLGGRPVPAADIGLVCDIAANGELASELPRLMGISAARDRADQAAILACLGDPASHERALRALTSLRKDDQAAAEMYLQHRPLRDPGAVRQVIDAIAAMPPSDAQAHALDVLARQPLGDPGLLDDLVRLFSGTRSLGVQRAIAGILIRGEYRVLAATGTARELRAHRLPSPDGEDMIDILIRRMERVS